MFMQRECNDILHTRMISINYMWKQLINKTPDCVYSCRWWCLPERSVCNLSLEFPLRCIQAKSNSILSTEKFSWRTIWCIHSPHVYRWMPYIDMISITSNSNITASISLPHPFPPHTSHLHNSTLVTPISAYFGLVCIYCFSVSENGHS